VEEIGIPPTRAHSGERVGPNIPPIFTANQATGAIKAPVACYLGLLYAIVIAIGPFSHRGLKFVWENPGGC
jgi:hypothetical protein